MTVKVYDVFKMNEGAWLTIDMQRVENGQTITNEKGEQAKVILTPYFDNLLAEDKRAIKINKSLDAKEIIIS